MLKCFLRNTPSGSTTCVPGVSSTVTVPDSWDRTVIEAPLRPLITPLIWELCAAATPHNRKSAARARVNLDVDRVIFFLVIFIMSSRDLLLASCWKGGCQARDFAPEFPSWVNVRAGIYHGFRV